MAPGFHVFRAGMPLAMTILFACVGPASAQDGQRSAPRPHADRIAMHGGEYVPRFTGLPHVLVVPQGTTVTLPQDSTWDSIEVAGTLRVSRTHDTLCRFTHLTVLPGGTLDMGTEADPVLRSVEFVVRDVPIDTTRDPYGWGNGILNLGTWTSHGRPLARTWTNTTSQLEAGAQVLRVPAALGWQAGDRLLIPDTRQMYNGQPDTDGVRHPAVRIRRESPVSVAAVRDAEIVLSKPLDFEHPAARDPDGTLRFMPYVANATRNVVIRSENPSGTRGHTVTLGAGVMDVRYTAFLHLGRTRPEPLDNTSADGSGRIIRIGTNQIARYALHWHHVHDHSNAAGHTHAHGGRSIGNFFDGSDHAKWALVIHGTSGMYVADTVIDNFVGGGIVTEDGDEFRNVIERNFVMGSRGNGAEGSLNLLVAQAPGAEGAGYWFHSAENVIRGNVAINNVIGFNFMAMGYPKGLASVGRVPIEFADNHAVANQKHGLEVWKTSPEFTASRFAGWHNGTTQATFGTDTTGSLTLVEPILLAKGGLTTGLHTSIGYTILLDITGGEIRGCSEGLRPVRGRANVRNVTLQNLLNINLAESGFLSFHEFDSVNSLPLPGRSARHVAITEVTRGLNIYDYRSNIGYRVILRNWQRKGTNYTLHSPRALPDRPIPDGILPEQGLTNGTAWAKYGVAIDGGPVPQDAIPMEGTNGYARPFTGETPDIPLGSPRLVILRPIADFSRASSDIEAEFTGRSASPVLRMAFDGSAKAASIRNSFTAYSSMGTYTDRSVLIKSTDISIPSGGPRTVRTWREDDGGRTIPGSELTFSFLSGSSSSRSEARR